MTICPECHYPSQGACDNPACPHDKTGSQLDAILQAQDAWLERQMYELRQRFNAIMAYAPSKEKSNHA